MDSAARHQVAQALRAAAQALSASKREQVFNFFAQTLGELREQIELRREDYQSGELEAQWQIGGSWRVFYRAGREWGDYVIDHLAIPPKKAKAVEMAVRLFQKNYGRSGPRPNHVAWYDKNKKRFDVLVDAADWPERSEDDDIFKHGPFTVHNTINASEVEVEKAMRIVDMALKNMTRSELPGFREMAYGHIYLVGEIGRKNWAAWYMEDKDVIYLRPRIRGRDVAEYAKTLIHELGHRYWRKKVDRETKREWMIHHQRMLDEPGEVVLPEVGEVLDDAKVNNKTPKVVAYEPEGVLLHNARNDKPIGHMPLWQFKRFMAEINATGKFPSIYAAKGGPEEHFCEALSFKAMGDLDPVNVAAFDRVVLGKDMNIAASQPVLAKLSKHEQEWWTSTGQSTEARMLQRMLVGKKAVLWHGTTADFKRFNPKLSRTELVDRFYGPGIFLTPSKKVAWQYANANRNIGFPPSIIDDFRRVNPFGADFMEALVKKGMVAWDEAKAPFKDASGRIDSEAWDKAFGGVEAGDIDEIAGRIAVPNNKIREDWDKQAQEGFVNIFSTQTGMDSWVYDRVDDIGLDSDKYRPKVYMVSVGPLENVLVTTRKAEARTAKRKGYDAVIFMGSDLVGDVPEVAVFDPRKVKIMGRGT